VVHVQIILWLLRQHESGHFLTYGHFMSRPTAFLTLSNSRFILTFRYCIQYMTYQFKRNPNTIPVSKIICTCTKIFLKFYNKCVNKEKLIKKNIDDIFIFACQLWPKYDFNADLYLLQRNIWRDKKNINMTINGGQIRFYLRIYYSIWLTSLKEIQTQFLSPRLFVHVPQYS
jgi:hypothetical protein